jgi:uncharacterized protein YbjQ (UPF0145 family)
MDTTGTDTSGRPTMGSPIISNRLAEGLAALSRPPEAKRGVTSNLSIDEVLLLHATGWEPAGLVFAISEVTIPEGSFRQLYVGGPPVPVHAANAAFYLAFQNAVKRLIHERSTAGGLGVVGVAMELDVAVHHLTIQLTGTAIRRFASNPPQPRQVDGSGEQASRSQPFISDLSARDFILLERAGFEPVTLACGAGFVKIPPRPAGMALTQATQNVELDNYTQGIYAARESAMKQLQHMAAIVRGTGVVGVNLNEGPLPFDHHVIGFTCWGTVVRASGDSYRAINPYTVVELDDPIVQFAAEALRRT